MKHVNIDWLAIWHKAWLGLTSLLEAWLSSRIGSALTSQRPRFHGQVRLRTAQLRLRASCPADGTRFHGLIPH